MAPALNHKAQGTHDTALPTFLAQLLTAPRGLQPCSRLAAFAHRTTQRGARTSRLPVSADSHPGEGEGVLRVLRRLKPGRASTSAKRAARSKAGEMVRCTACTHCNVLPCSSQCRKESVVEPPSCPVNLLLGARGPAEGRWPAAGRRRGEREGDWMAGGLAAQAWPKRETRSLGAARHGKAAGTTEKDRAHRRRSQADGSCCLYLPRLLRSYPQLLVAPSSGLRLY